MNDIASNAVPARRRLTDRAPWLKPSGGDSGAEPDQGSAIRAALLTLRRFRWTFVLAVLVCVAAGVAVIVMVEPQYTATSRVSIDQRIVDVDPTAAVVRPVSEAQEAVDSEAELIRSRGLAVRVVTALGLVRDPEFQAPAGHPTTFDSVVSAVAAKMAARRIGLSNVVEIAFQSADPGKAARIANAFAEQYLAAQLSLKTGATRDADVYLRATIDKVRSEAQRASAAVEQYRSANNLLSAGVTTLTEQEISNLNQQHSLAQVQQVEAAAKLNAARRQLAFNSRAGDVAETLQSPVVQQLRAQRADLSRQVADLSGRYGPDYPAVINVTHQLADVEASIAAEIGRITSSLAAQAEIANQRAGALGENVQQLKGTLARNSAASVHLQELSDNADALRAQYESLLARYRQISVRAMTDRPDATLVARAFPSTRPSWPNIPLTLLFAGTMGVVLGAIAVMMRHNLARGLRTGDEVERRVGLPLLAAIPLRRDRSRTPTRGTILDEVRHSARSPLTAGMRNLAVSLETIPVRPGYGRSILFTSALPDEGKTISALSLATLLAVDARVILVDLDIRRSASSALLGYASPGIEHVLTGEAALDDAIRQDTGSSLHYLGTATTDVRLEPTSAQLGMLIRELEKRFDVVVIDSPPVLAVPYTRLAARLAGGVALVVRWDRTPLDIVRTTVEQLRKADAHIMGVVLNGVDPRAGGEAGPGDPAYYGKMIAKYYQN